MRIAFVTTEYIKGSKIDGGLANYIHRVSLSLYRLGHKPIVVFPSDTCNASIKNGIEIHPISFPKNVWVDRFNRSTMQFFLRFSNLVLLSWKLNQTIKKIHARQPLSIIQYSHLGGVGLFKLDNIPSVVRLSSYTPLCRIHGGYNYENSFLVRQQELIERWALRRSDRVFAPSKIIASVVEKDIGKPVEIIETPFFVEIEKMDERLYHEQLNDKTYLLFVGTLNRLKGVATIAEVIHELLDKFPNLFFVFIGREMAGNRGDSMKEVVIKKAGEYINRIRFLGVLPHEQLYPILSHAHAVILPSMIDNFPNVCLEAMSFNRVVIGTKGTSFEQIIVDGENGLLCEPGNPKNLLETIEKVMKLTDVQRKKMGELAWKRIHELRPEKATKQLELYYQKTIKNYFS